MRPLIILMCIAVGTTANLDHYQNNGQCNTIPNWCSPCGKHRDVNCSVIQKIPNVTSFSKCCSLCQNLQNCNAYTWSSAQCILKDEPNIQTNGASSDRCTSGWILTPQPKAQKNILYIVVDDLRDEVGFTNRRKGLITPNLDKLAEKSLIFDRAYVQQGVCSPSRNSFMSGRRPDTTKVWNFKNSFRETLGNNVTSWPGAFKNNGWISVGMGKVYHPHHPAEDDGTLSWSLDLFPYFHPKQYANKISNAPDNTFQDGMIADKAVETLQKIKNLQEDKPFFMAVGFHKPHIPWVMPQRFLEEQLSIEETDIPLHDKPAHNYCNVSLYVCDNVYSGIPQNPAAKSVQQQNRRLYRAAVSWTDFNVGRVITELSNLGFENDTVIIFHGDHGWHLGEQGQWCKQSNAELVARVPLLVHVPWIPQSHGKRTSALVEVVDLMPTTLDLLNISANVHDANELEGLSFLPLLQDPRIPSGKWKNATFTQYPRCFGSTGQSPWDYPSDNACTSLDSKKFAAMGYSIRTDNWRYTLWVKWNGETLSPIWNDVVGEELYNHTSEEPFMDTDAYENNNIVNEPSLSSLKMTLRQALQDGWRRARPH